MRGNLFAALGNIRATHLYDVALRQALGIAEASGEDPLAQPAEPLIQLRQSQ